MEDETILVPTGPCRVCHDPAPRAVNMPLIAFVAWMDHTPVEEAWPEATPQQVRQLMEGTCPHHPM